MKFPSGNTLCRWIVVSFVFFILAIYIYGETLQSHKSPEEQTRDILKKYLVESEEVDRIRFANCSRIEESEADRLPNVSFFIGCEVKKPLSADPIILSVAFGGRGQVEFMDISRGEE
ncbi:MULTISPECIES: hypothetical protein [unclassified Rhizobium]|uniref:hypothetical protein n=1 Tax=unclassified Rhizobium TaxID=2613769 RepID=UPI001C83BA4D|nr:MULTISPECIES: hypothetical protein [unclassified Rhizobium]MBX5167748.1 hypothetical protein [Rhizobium sp. NZLR4b]MBX5211795.1 hypothetical protein [Rhizobium sp. NZLR11]